MVPDDRPIPPSRIGAPMPKGVGYGKKNRRTNKNIPKAQRRRSKKRKK